MSPELGLFAFAYGCQHSSIGITRVSAPNWRGPEVGPEQLGVPADRSRVPSKAGTTGSKRRDGRMHASSGRLRRPSGFRKDAGT